jgi:hypothetical protein
LNSNGHQVTERLCVDDLLMSSVNEYDIERVVSEMHKKYESFTLTSGLVQSYLGQTFHVRVQGDVPESMEGYIRDAIYASGVKSFRSTHGGMDTCDITEGLPLLAKGEQDDFHSLVMRLKFLLC